MTLEQVKKWLDALATQEVPFTVLADGNGMFTIEIEHTGRKLLAEIFAMSQVQQHLQIRPTSTHGVMID